MIMHLNSTADNLLLSKTFPFPFLRTRVILKNYTSVILKLNRKTRSLGINVELRLKGRPFLLRLNKERYACQGQKTRKLTVRKMETG